MLFHPIPLHDSLCQCVILQAMDHEVLKEIEQALKKNKTLEKLTIRRDNYSPSYFPKEFCYHFLLGARQNTSLSYLRLESLDWDCSYDGRLACQSHCVTQLDVVYMFCVVTSNSEDIYVKLSMYT